jgi:hypothetical protein
MHPQDILDIFGGLIMLAVLAVFLTKPNTASDVNAVGNQFTGVLKQAEAG